MPIFSRKRGYFFGIKVGREVMQVASAVTSVAATVATAGIATPTLAAVGIPATIAPVVGAAVSSGTVSAVLGGNTKDVIANTVTAGLTSGLSTINPTQPIANNVIVSGVRSTLTDKPIGKNLISDVLPSLVSSNVLVQGAVKGAVDHNITSGIQHIAVNSCDILKDRINDMINFEGTKDEIIKILHNNRMAMTRIRQENPDEFTVDLNETANNIDKCVQKSNNQSSKNYIETLSNINKSIKTLINTNGNSQTSFEHCVLDGKLCVGLKTDGKIFIKYDKSSVALGPSDVYKNGTAFQYTTQSGPSNKITIQTTPLSTTQSNMCYSIQNNVNTNNSDLASTTKIDINNNCVAGAVGTAAAISILPPLVSATAASLVPVMACADEPLNKKQKK